MLGSYYYVPVLFLSSSLCTYYWQLWGVRYDGLGHVWLSKAGLVLSSLSHFAEILFLKTWSLTHINSQLMFSSLYQNPVHNTPIATLTAYVFASRSATTFTVLKSTSFFFFYTYLISLSLFGFLRDIMKNWTIFSPFFIVPCFWFWLFTVMQFQSSSLISILENKNYVS